MLDVGGAVVGVAVGIAGSNLEAFLAVVVGGGGDGGGCGVRVTLVVGTRTVMALVSDGGLLLGVVVGLVVLAAVVVVDGGTTSSPTAMLGLVTRVTHAGWVAGTNHGGGNRDGVEAGVVDAGKHW